MTKPLGQFPNQGFLSEISSHGIERFFYRSVTGSEAGSREWKLMDGSCVESGVQLFGTAGGHSGVELKSSLQASHEHSWSLSVATRHDLPPSQEAVMVPDTGC